MISGGSSGTKYWPHCPEHGTLTVQSVTVDGVRWIYCDRQWHLDPAILIDTPRGG